MDLYNAGTRDGYRCGYGGCDEGGECGVVRNLGFLEVEGRSGRVREGRSWLNGTKLKIIFCCALSEADALKYSEPLFLRKVIWNLGGWANHQKVVKFLKY